MNKQITLFLATLLVAGALLAFFIWGGNKGPEGEKNPSSATPTPINTSVTISPDDPIRGNPQAKVTIVEFSDFQCPFCGEVEPVLKQILETYPDQVRLVYKDYPLPSHENAENAALAALCAKEQDKFWEYHNLLFENQGSLMVADLKKYAQDIGLKTGDFNSCLDGKKYRSQVEDDLKEGVRVEIRGTPAFFINGRPLTGAQPFENFKVIIEEELEK